MSQLERGETPIRGKPYLDAIIAEQKHRAAILQSEHDTILKEFRALELEVDERKRKQPRLTKEKNHLEETP